MLGFWLGFKPKEKQTMEESSSEQEIQNRSLNSDNQNPQNGTASQNPQSEKTLGFVKTPPDSSEFQKTSVPSSSSAIDGEVVPELNKKQQQYEEDDSDYKNALDEDIHQVIYKESLNEAVMNLALGEDRSAPGGNMEGSYFDGVGGIGTGMNGDAWEGSDGGWGGSGNVGAMQGQYGNDEVEGEDEEEESYGGGRNYNQRHHPYPLRIDAEDCPFYMKTGSCKFGMNCKFNHPPKRKNQGMRDRLKPRAEDPERLAQTECKYYMTSAGCKFGNACKYSHSRERSSVSPIVEFNFLGLPIRLGEKECPYYMRTGSCKYGSNCKFNHPDPTSASGNDHASGYGNGGSVNLHGSAHSTALSWSSSSMMLPQNQGIPSNPDWNGYQTTSYPTSERSLPTPPAFAMNNPVTDTNLYVPHQLQMPVDEFPQRPGQPECTYFLKTGDCKYRANCRFHHPKLLSPNSTPCALSDKGLPLRPDQSICSFYNRYGICKFGPACKFDHPENWGKTLSSDGVRMPRNEMEAGFS